MTVVTSRLTGNFPGSPITLTYWFDLDGQKITRRVGDVRVLR